MAGSQADTGDFTDLFSTNLDTGTDGPVDNALTYAKDLNQEYNDETSQTATQTKYIELWSAFVHLRQTQERAVTMDSVGGASSEFEGDELGYGKTQLRSWIQRAGGDTSMADAFSTTPVDTSRYVTSG